MKAMMLEVPEALLEERRRCGGDRHDEMWEGVLHVVPQPFSRHQRMGTEFLVVADPLAKARGLLSTYEIGFYRSGVDDDYRVPDHVYCQPEYVTDRGVEGPVEMVVEIRSPNDETYDKLDWYAARGVHEVLVLHPDTRTAELFVNRDGRMVLVEPGPDGVFVETLGIWLATVEGPRLRITWDTGSANI